MIELFNQAAYWVGAVWLGLFLVEVVGGVFLLCSSALVSLFVYISDAVRGRAYRYSRGMTAADYRKALNDRVDVEGVLYDVYNGKRPPLSGEECRDLAVKLGVPEKWLI